MFQQINRLPKAFKNALLFLLIAAFFTLGAAAAEALVIEGSVLSSIDVGKTYQATVKDLRIDENNVRYKSSDTSIIKIGKKDGKITPVAPGKATLTAYNVTNNKSLCNRTITVYLRTESIEVFPQRLYLYTSKPFNSFAFTVMKKFPENSTDTITPQSDNKDIAGAGALSTNISAGDAGKTTIRFYARRTRASSIDSEYSTLMSSTIEVFVHEHNTYSTKWTAADSFYHYRACDKDDCPLFRIGTEMDYEEHDFSSYGICRRCRYYKAAKEKTMSIRLTFSPPMKPAIFGNAPTPTAARPSIMGGMSSRTATFARSAAIRMSMMHGKRALPFRRTDIGLPVRKAAVRQEKIIRSIQRKTSPRQPAWRIWSARCAA